MVVNQEETRITKVLNIKIESAPIDHSKNEF